VLSVNLSKNAPPPIARLKDEDYTKYFTDPSNEKKRDGGGLLERRSTSAQKDPTANLILDENDLGEAVDLDSITKYDLGLLGYTDVSCPICFGSGFVGGYSPMGGMRKVFCFGTDQNDMVLPFDAEIQPIEDIPTVTTRSVEFWMTFPASAAFVDAFQLWNRTEAVPLPDQMAFEDTDLELSSPKDLLRYCDGKRHKLTFQWENPVTFTHMEIQFGLSGFDANFELPKLSRSSDQSILENTDPFQVVLSPRVPFVQPLDVIVESTHGKVLEVKSVSGWNDRKRTILGWEVDVRPVQPQELFSMLPRRLPEEVLNSRSIVVDNFSSDYSNKPSRT